MRAPVPNMSERPAESPRTGRHVGVVLWCSVLSASVAAMVAFALVDPAAMHGTGEAPHWWTTRLTVYGLGFFFFWLVAGLASALTLYMVRTEPPS